MEEWFKQKVMTDIVSLGGQYYYWPRDDRSGALSASDLRKVADLLDQLHRAETDRRYQEPRVKEGKTMDGRFARQVARSFESLENGYYCYWPLEVYEGLTASTLRNIADLLDWVNEPWDQQVQEYHRKHLTQE